LENADIFVGDLAKRVDGRIQITSDSFRPYQQIVRKYLLGRLDFATMQKLFEVPLMPKRKQLGAIRPPEHWSQSPHSSWRSTAR
jgi:hypothetical protein